MPTLAYYCLSFLCYHLIKCHSDYTLSTPSSLHSAGFRLSSICFTNTHALLQITHIRYKSWDVQPIANNWSPTAAPPSLPHTLICKCYFLGKSFLWTQSTYISNEGNPTTQHHFLLLVFTLIILGLPLPPRCTPGRVLPRDYIPGLGVQPASTGPSFYGVPLMEGKREGTGKKSERQRASHPLVAVVCVSRGGCRSPSLSSSSLA